MEDQHTIISTKPSEISDISNKFLKIISEIIQEEGLSREMMVEVRERGYGYELMIRRNHPFLTVCTFIIEPGPKIYYLSCLGYKRLVKDFEELIEISIDNIYYVVKRDCL